MKIYDFDVEDEIQKNEIALQNVELIKNSFADHTAEYRKFSREVNVEFSALSDCIDAYERALLIGVYTYAEQLVKNFYYELLEKDIGIVSAEHAEKIFLHEYYKELLKKQYLKDDSIVDDFTKYYEKHCADSIDSCIDIVLLQLQKDDVEFTLIAHELENILNENCNDYQALKCYQILLRLPSKYRNFIREEEIYFQMSDIAIRIASWKDSQTYLKKILKVKQI